MPQACATRYTRRAGLSSLRTTSLRRTIDGERSDQETEGPRSKEHNISSQLQAYNGDNSCYCSARHGVRAVDSRTRRQGAAPVIVVGAACR